MALSVFKQSCEALGPLCRPSLELPPIECPSKIGYTATDFSGGGVPMATDVSCPYCGQRNAAHQDQPSRCEQCGRVISQVVNPKNQSIANPKSSKPPQASTSVVHVRHGELEGPLTDGDRHPGRLEVSLNELRFSDANSLRRYRRF
jgi:hypothetical protein